MSVSELQRLIELMRRTKIQPSDICREKLDTTAPKELLAHLSFQEFTRLVEEVKACNPGA